MKWQNYILLMVAMVMALRIAFAYFDPAHVVWVLVMAWALGAWLYNDYRRFQENRAMWAAIEDLNKRTAKALRLS